MATYNETATGGSVSSGVSDNFKYYLYTPFTTPEPRINGEFTCTAIYNIAATGGGVIGTLASPGITEFSFGGAEVGGLAIEIFVQQETGSGGCIVSGGDLLFTIAKGGAEVSGTASVSAIYNYRHQDSEVRVLIEDSVFSIIAPEQPGGVTINSNYFLLEESNVVPASGSSDSAKIVTTFENAILRWDININQISSAVTNIRIHGPAASGATGPLLFDLGSYCDITVANISGAVSVPSANLSSLHNGLWYIQITTEDYPSGSIRGQIVLSGTKALTSVHYNPIGSYPPTQTVGLGGAELGGSSVSSLNGDYAYDETGDGGVIVNGLAEGNFQIPRGGVICGGISDNYISRDHTPSGGVTVSGETYNALIDVMQGGVTLCCIEGDVHNIYYSNVPIGGAEAGGSSITTLNGFYAYDETGDGGAVLNGSNSNVVITVPVISGGVEVGGSAVMNVTRDFLVSGGSVCSGNSDEFSEWYYTIVDGRFQIEPSQVVPSSSSTRSGSALVTLDNENIMSWNIQFSEGAVSNINLRGPAAEGIVGSLIGDLIDYSTNLSPCIGSVVLPDFLVPHVKDSLLYIEIVKDGVAEIRGQIYLANTGGEVGGLSDIPITEIASGGLKASGSADVLAYPNLSGVGGATGGGSAVKLGLVYPSILGGAEVGGSAVTEFIYNHTVTGGGTVGGRGVMSLSLFGSGGVTIGGETTELHLVLPDISGGVVVSGTPKIIDYYLSRKVFGGIKAGGKAKTVLVVTLESFTTGIGRSLLTPNLIKELEAALLAKTELYQIRDELTPEADNDATDGEWCDVVIRCDEGVLPEIIQGRQGEHLPDGEVTVKTR